MKINGYVENLIKRRERLALQLDIAYRNLDHYLDSNKIETEIYDSHGGTEIYVNPTESAERIRKAILQK